MWWQPILDSLPPIVNGGVIGTFLLLIANGKLWTKSAVDRAVLSLEHERDQAIVDRDWFKQAWLDEMNTSRSYQDSAVRVAIPAAVAAERNLQSITDLATGGDPRGSDPAKR